MCEGIVVKGEGFKVHIKNFLRLANSNKRQSRAEN